jgi:hypothetical protein
MANGGIIGPPNTPNPFCQAEVITVKTANGSMTTAPLTTEVSVLVVAGGGGGGGGTCCGSGGGAGGTNITPVSVCGASPYSVTIGAGGAGGTSPSANPAGKGTDSIFAPGTPIAITNCGGGAGSGYGAIPLNPPSLLDGGSGGGMGNDNLGCGGTGVPGQGFPGGSSGPNSTDPPGGWNGGGGGASAAGGRGVAPGEKGGCGGAGLDVTPTFGCAPQPFYLTDSPTAGLVSTGFFAGGGGGGSFPPATPSNSQGGVGGGGDGYIGGGAGNAGVVNSGGGGGGSGDLSGHTPVKVGGLGGSGMVIIKEAALSGTNASGMWSQQEQYEYSLAGDWQ